MAAEGRFGALVVGKEGTMSLQIIDGPRRVRTGDLRRAQVDTIVLVGTDRCR
jgi:hypothetical protein